MNILITSVGRRNYLVDYFKEAVKNYGGLVHACNSDVHAAGLYVADKWVISPLIYARGYIDFLIEYCKQNQISIILPLFDLDLPILSKAQHIFTTAGIRVIVADEWVTRIARDKVKTQIFLSENGFNTMPYCTGLDDFEKLQKSERIYFPVFVKPRFGMASLYTYKAKNMKELVFYFNKIAEEIPASQLKYESITDFENQILIQSVLPGYEYGLDVINDLDGKYCTTIVKRKIAMRAGETDIAETVYEPLLFELGRQIAIITKHPGNMDIDVFFDGEKAYILEMNPRFGGGYPFSHDAGANLPLAIIKWVNGESFDAQKILSVNYSIKSFKGITMINNHKANTPST